jgi:hypothetical protein
MFNYDPDQRHHITLHVVIETLSPLSQIGEAVGNQSNLRTITITDLEGQSTPIFCLSGNSIRNRILRRVGVDDMLSKLAIRVNPGLHHTLFCGGALDGGTSNDLELDQKIRKFLPPISLLGTAKPKGVFGTKDAQMVPGRLNVGDAMLICYESGLNIFNTFAPALPVETIEGLTAINKAKKELNLARVNAFLAGENFNSNGNQYQETLKYWLPFLEEKLRPYPQWLTYCQKTRRDSHHDSNLVKHLIPTAGAKTLFGESDDKKAKSNQMIMGSWLIQQGATLYSRWDGYITDVEEGYMARALLNWSNNPYLGGQANTGCGKVALKIYYSSQGQTGEWLQVDNGQQILTDRSKQAYCRYEQYLEQYENYLKENSLEIAGILG